MSSRNQRSEVNLEYGHLVDRIKGYDQKDWMKACERLGLCVRPEAGRGSHCAVYSNEVWPPESDAVVVTLASNYYPQIQRATLKKIIGYGVLSGRYTEKDVWDALKVKIK